jgi:type IV pilus assembly protein PilC
MSWRYRAKDAFGHILDGQVDAPTQEEASQTLKRQGLTVVTIDEDESESGFWPARVSRSDLIKTTTQLALMVDTGISLSASLEGILREERNPELRRILRELRAAVEEGDDFSAALARFPEQFDPTYVALVRASEATGTLAEMLDRISHYLRKALDTRAKVRAAMTYPAVMLALAAGVTVFLLTYIMPKFVPIFEKKGVELPGPTRFLMGVSAILSEYWVMWLLLVVAALVAVPLGWRSDAGRKLRDWITIHLPLLGPVLKKAILARSLRTLGSMVDSGVSLLDALRLCGDVASNRFYLDAFVRVSEQVIGGSSISAALAGQPLFPSMLVQMISAAEQTGKLPEVLERVADHYDGEIETSLKVVTSTLEPMLITMMGLIVGGIAMSLLLPIFSLSRHAG